MPMIAGEQQYDKSISLQFVDVDYLLSAIANDDEAAFKKIFDIFRPPVYSYAVHLLKDERLADEIVQDVFLKVWMKRARLLEIQNFKAWLYTIARNEMIDALKAKMKTYKITNEEMYLVVYNPVEDTLFEKDCSRLIKETLHKLSPQQRLVYTLSRNKGLKHEEIASQLNISQNTVKTHIVSALRILKKHLSPFLHIICIWFFMPGK